MNLPGLEAQRRRALRGAVILVVGTLAMAGIVMWMSLPAHSRPLPYRHAAPSHRAPDLPRPRYRRDDSLRADIGRWLSDHLTRR